MGQGLRCLAVSSLTAALVAVGSGCASIGGGATGGSRGPSAAHSAGAGQTAAPGGGNSSQGGLPSVSADNPGCVFTVAEMDAILANPADPHPHVHVNVGTAAAKAANTPDDHVCLFGDLPVGSHSYRYFSDVEVRCGPEGKQQFQDLTGVSTDSPAAHLVHENVGSALGGMYFVWVHECSVSALRAFSLTPKWVGARAPVVAALSRIGHSA
jgi:hypothetical protein